MCGKEWKRKEKKVTKRKGKKIINSIYFNHTFPIAITVNNETISNPSAVVNAFNNSFAKVAKDIQSSLRFS